MDKLDTFHVRVITPAGTALETEAVFIKFHSQSGEIGVLANHSPTLAKITVGELVLTSQSNHKEFYLITSGLAEIQRDKVTLLVPFIEKGTHLDLSRAKSAETRALDRLENPTANTDTSRAKQALTRARARLHLHDLIEKALQN
jgi:F-type H+-transporting ATPase subunit epsilon